ncbi:MAG: glycosyltransferase family 2 protein [Planctomycetes bacterium]|nr:glycosyltransferase family 2 protein [Planctomycetota bacterium]
MESIENITPSAADARVSAVICNYNGERYLRDLLNSVAAQTLPPSETIVVDNASTDGSVELLNREFPSVRVIRMQQNEGPCPARNRGMRDAAFDRVLALDCDVVLAPDCLEKLYSAVARDPAIAAASPRAVADEDPRCIQYDGAFFHYVGLLVLRNFYVPVERAVGAGTVDVDAFVSLALLVDRGKLLAAGGYDPAFFILFEDNDLSYRLRSSGSRIVCVEDAIVRHRGGTEGTSFRAGLYPARRVYLHSRNRWLFILKNYQCSTILRGIPGLFVYECAAVAFALAKLAPIAYIRGKFSFIYHSPSALTARRATAGARRVGDRDLVRGGPLTLWPPLVASRGAAASGRVLDGILQLCWRALGGRP